MTRKKLVSILQILLFTAALAAIPVVLVMSASVEKIDELTFPQIVECSMQSIVEVHVEDYGIVGTGFYVGDGKIVTAGHITNSTAVSKVVFEDGTICESIGQFTCSMIDCGIIFIEPVNKPALRFDTDGVVRGEEVFICGNPMGVPFLLSTGVVSKVFDTEPDDWWSDTTLIVSSVPAHRGNSGSPLFDEDGEVVGMYVGSLRMTRCSAFPVSFAVSIPTEDILLVLDNAVMESVDAVDIEGEEL
ncbi:MAG: S1 family peptidase [Candidatus Kariarchaeaceae archaeon]|jgi:S1-C subfamily serine protease